MKEGTVQTHKALIKAIGILGSERRLAEVVGCSQPYVNRLKNTGRCSAEFAVKIHAATEGQVPKWELRPDLWEPLPTSH